MKWFTHITYEVIYSHKHMKWFNHMTMKLRVQYVDLQVGSFRAIIQLWGTIKLISIPVNTSDR